MAVGFEEDIKPIFAPYAACMAGVTIATSQGAFPVLLDDYERVKLLHAEIRTAIRGYDPATPTAHPMPPGGTPLPTAQLDLYDQWIDEGMQRSRAIA
jgi:hypothetical protein